MTLAPPTDLHDQSPRHAESGAAGSEAAGASELAAQLADPQVDAALASLLSHADLLALLVEGLDGFIGRSEEIGDNVIGGLSELRAAVNPTALLAGSGVDLPALLSAVTSLASALPRVTPALVAAVDGGAADQLGVVATGLGKGNADFSTHPVAVGGALTLLRLLKDPDINRAISYLATILRAIGRELAVPAPSPSRPSPLHQSPSSSSSTRTPSVR